MRRRSNDDQARAISTTRQERLASPAGGVTRRSTSASRGRRANRGGLLFDEGLQLPEGLLPRLARLLDVSATGEPAHLQGDLGLAGPLRIEANFQARARLPRPAEILVPRLGRHFESASRKPLAPKACVGSGFVQIRKT